MKQNQTQYVIHYAGGLFNIGKNIRSLEGAMCVRLFGGCLPYTETVEQCREEVILGNKCR